LLCCPPATASKCTLHVLTKRGILEVTKFLSQRSGIEIPELRIEIFLFHSFLFE